MPGEDQLEEPATRWDFLVERLNKVDNRLNKIDNCLSALEDAQKHVGSMPAALTTKAERSTKEENTPRTSMAGRVRYAGASLKFR